jgi:Cu(I)/Ag(I) efflux system membrane protein CusA/SilA
MVIKTEDAVRVAYVTFDRLPGYAETDVVEAVDRYLRGKRTGDGADRLEMEGVTYSFAGNYENQVRFRNKLKLMLPLALFLIFMILYFQFRRVSTTVLVFSGIAVAWAGGFIMIWLYDQPWFLDFSVFGVGMRDLFQVHTINLSVAVWVGFLALFGIATDDGVVMATYLKQMFAERRPATQDAVREATRLAAARRVRPCLMTTATTVLALIPVLTSTGRGADIMVPMAIPAFGGMIFEVVTMFVVPVLYSGVEEIRLKLGRRTGHGA